MRINREKFRFLPPDMQVSFITPARVHHPMQQYEAEVSHEWPHAIIPAYHTHRLSSFAFSPLALFRALQEFCPQVVQIDEEPPSLAVLQALLLRKLLGYRTVLFTWENMAPRYALPFQATRRLALSWSDAIMAGNTEAALRLKRAGFRKPLAIIPQLGVDETRFAPRLSLALRSELGLAGFTVGYVGRLVEEKGLLHLANALANLPGQWQWLIVGTGPLRERLDAHLRKLGIADRVRWAGVVPHGDVPRFLNAMDVLVLPSISTARWKEQFGHVLIEAMACGVPVVGSDSGAIPEVIGDGGLIVPQADEGALTTALECLSDDADLRRHLGRRGRERVLAHFTNEVIAQRTAAFWREACPCD